MSFPGCPGAWCAFISEWRSRRCRACVAKQRAVRRAEVTGRPVASRSCRVGVCALVLARELSACRWWLVRVPSSAQRGLVLAARGSGEGLGNCPTPSFCGTRNVPFACSHWELCVCECALTHMVPSPSCVCVSIAQSVSAGVRYTGQLYRVCPPHHTSIVGTPLPLLVVCLNGCPG